MTKPFFPAGQTVYREDGAEGQYVAAVPDSGHLVRPLLEIYGDDEPSFELGAPTLWTKVYPEPPQQKYAKDIADAMATLESTQRQLNEARGDLRRVTAEQAHVQKVLKKHDVLQRFCNVMDGKVTHIVEFSYHEVEVKELPHGRFPTDFYVARSERGGFHWWARVYDSRDKVRVLPCTSEEEANEAARSWLREELNGYNHSVSQAMVDCAKRFGVPVPEKVTDQLRAWKKNSVLEARKRLKEVEQALARAEADLKADEV